MELREYFRIVFKNWWIIVLLTLISLAGVLVISYAQTPIFRTTSSYVTGLDATIASSFDDTIYGIDTLTGRQRIFVTYCELIRSQTVRDRAFELTGLNPADPSLEDYKTTCNVLPESNILLLLVDGPSPALTMRLNEAIGLAGMERTNSLYTYFPLEKLDSVSIEEVPISPDYAQNAVLGILLGLVVGVTLAFIIEYLRSPREQMEAMSIRNARLGVYNDRYFNSRLDEEINRARTRNRPISLAVLQLVPDEDFSLLQETTRDALLRQAALLIQGTVSDDIVAYFGRYRFGILLAETPGQEAYDILLKLHATIRSKNFKDHEFETNFLARTGLVESSGGALGGQAMLARASEALTDTEAGGDQAIHIIRTTPQPFFTDAQASQANTPATNGNADNGGLPTLETDQNEAPVSGNE
ncbi:Wzz/FepE/Etk N-terminal domain-containing protein [Chloroflexota bacterium]